MTEETPMFVIFSIRWFEYVLSFVNSFLSKQIYLHFLKLHTAGFPIFISCVGCPLTAFLSTELFFGQTVSTVILL